MWRNTSVDEWTLCLGKRDVPGSAQSESDGEKDTEENGDDREGGEEAETKGRGKEYQGEERPQGPKGEKASISDGERGRCFMARRSLPQLRVV